MNLVFKESFEKDIENINQNSVLSAIERTINHCEAAEKPADIPNLKKMRGHTNAFRIRIGNYRIGVFMKGNSIEFIRVLSRSVIYKNFPK
jgi:mRNA interferase RelE/StbE